MKQCVVETYGKTKKVKTKRVCMCFMWVGSGGKEGKYKKKYDVNKYTQ